MIEVLKQALEALEAHADIGIKADKAIKSIRQAISDLEKQEPVAWIIWLHGPVRLFLNKDEAMMEFNRLNKEYPVDNNARQMKPLYTTPPKREWVELNCPICGEMAIPQPPKREPLSDEQLIAAYESEQQGRWGDHVRGLRAVEEAAHGIGEMK
jgi:hypothetical protein